MVREAHDRAIPAHTGRRSHGDRAGRAMCTHVSGDVRCRGHTRTQTHCTWVQAMVGTCSRGLQKGDLSRFLPMLCGTE